MALGFKASIKRLHISILFGDFRAAAYAAKLVPDLFKQGGVNWLAGSVCL
jgi:hypothetical protein